MKRVLIIAISVISIFLNINKVNANSINSIDMDIYIDFYGTATVKEVWNAYLTKGTEGYKIFSDLKNSNIKNFTVTDETGKKYIYISPWYTENSFQEKAYKNGFNYNGSDLELCWGISKYGYKTYTLYYQITNFVTEYEDYQGIYFKLLKLNQKAKNVNIKISTHTSLNVNNSKIWGLGYEGTINFENDEILINANNLKSYEYITLLMKFENKLFEINNKIDKHFENIYDEAMQDTKNDLGFISNIFINHPYVAYIICIIMFVIIFIVILLCRYAMAFLLTILSNILENIFPNNNYEYKKSIIKLKKNKNINYYREIPCNKDINLAYFILNKLNIIKAKTLKKGVIGAYILKWLNLGYITVSDDKKNLIINRDIYNKIQNKEISLNNSTENKLYKIMYKASNDSILNSNEFKKWSKTNYKMFNDWYKDILINKKNSLNAKGLIDHKDKTETTSRQEFSEELMNEAYNLIGLKKFLLDFSNINERSTIEVELWEYYLIFATLFGITDKIDKELKDLYPDLNIDEYIKFTEILKIIDDFSESSYRGMKTSININNFRNNFNRTLKSMDEGSGSSSGSGGSSFSSGGSSSGGSFGGGFR